MLCLWSSDSFLQAGSQVEHNHNLVVATEEIFSGSDDPNSTVRKGEKLRLLSLGEVAKCLFSYRN